MKRVLKAFIVMLMPFWAVSAQADICFEEWGYDPNCAIHVEGGNVTFEDIGTLKTTILTYRNNRVFAGPNSGMNGQLFTIFGDRIYHGSTTLQSNCAFTIIGDYVYRGDSFMDKDIVLTIYENKVYRGSSTSSSDLIFSYTDSEDLTPQLLVCIISGYL